MREREATERQANANDYDTVTRHSKPIGTDPSDQTQQGGLMQSLRSVTSMGLHIER